MRSNFHRRQRWLLHAGLVAALFVIVSSAVAAKRNPCAPLGSWATNARVAARRATVQHALPPAVWQAMESGGYYVCGGNRTESGRFTTISFKLPIPAIGRRVWFRVLWEARSSAEAIGIAPRI